MIIYELNNGDWPIRTRYCNKVRRSSFVIFHAKWLKRKFWSSLKRQQKAWFFLDYNLKTFSWHNVCVTARNWEMIGELTLSNFEKKKKNYINKNMSWESKSIHCAMKPIRIQLECPYNSSNKKYPCMSFYVFIFIAQAMYFLYISTCARGCKHKCAISFIQQRIATWCLIPWINQFLNESSEPVVQRSIQMVSLVSFLLNQPFWTNRLIWMIQ